MKTFGLVIVLSVLASPVSAQWLRHPTPGIPRTPDGKPNLTAPAPRTADGKVDLSGLWQRVSPKYRRNIAADLKPEEIQPWARELVTERMEDLGKGHMAVHCLPWGPGYTTSERLFKIVQTPAVILILDEGLVYRQIFMDGRPLPTDPTPTPNGYSIGAWDGDALVVTSHGFRDGTWLDRNGSPMSDAARVTERFRRINYGRLEVDVTVDDPKVYTRPWTVTLTQQIVLDTELLDYFCTDNEKDASHMVGK
jgi:hypothetical protein